MSRALIIVVILAALGVGGYYLVQNQRAAEMAEQAEAAAAAAAAEEAAVEAVEAAEEGAADAAAAVEEAVDAAVEAVTGTADADAEAATETDLATLFTEEGFDYDQAIAAVEAAEISTPVRLALTSALNAARDNPELLGAALTQARAALGIE